MPTSYLNALRRRGLRASLREGGILWLEPKSAITESIRLLARGHKTEIVAELETEAAEMSPPPASKTACDRLEPSLPYRCVRCKRPGRLKLTGLSYTFRCPCGYSSRVDPNDYSRLCAYERYAAESGENVRRSTEQ